MGTCSATASRTRPHTGVSRRECAAGRRALRRGKDELAAGDGVHEVDVHFQVRRDGGVGLSVDVERRADLEDLPEVQARQTSREQCNVPRGKGALKMQ